MTIISHPYPAHMSQLNYTAYEPKRTPQGVLLIFACAWCPKTSYRPLRKNEAYSHGICPMHKKHLLHKMLAGRAEH